jgi:hypothetical protein
MREQIQSSSWRGGHGERLWLSTLVETMKQVGQPPRRTEPCDAQVLKALRAQLVLPAQLRFPSRFPSRFGLRN